MPPSTSAIVAHQPIELDADEVRRVAKELTPEPIRTHYVVIDGRRFPPKQVLAEVTGIDRSDFISTQARSILARLGFSVARLQPRRAAAAAAVQPDWVHERAEKLRPYIGRYVATDEEGNVIASADDPLEVVAWLRRHARRGPGGLFKDRSSAATRLAAAGFPTGKTFDAWDPALSSIPAPTQTALRTLEWVGRRENLVVCGPSGTGKTMFLEALGHDAVAAGRKVAWFSLETLGILVRRHRADDSVTRAIARILRADLVVVDDIGLLPVAVDAAEGLYRLVDARL